MIRFNMGKDGDLQVQQITMRPSVYLDQWMWSSLSKNRKLREAFLKALANGGTIMYSFASMRELGGITDQQQLHTITEIMDSIDYGFVEVNPDTVIAREDANRRTKSYEDNPAVDIELVKLLVQITDSPRSLQVSAALVDLASSLMDPQLKADWATIGNGFELTVNPLLHAAREDPGVVTEAKKRIRSRTLTRSKPPYTRDILRLAIDFVQVNSQMKMGKGEWLDMMHTVVPVAYSDFVLLDKRWCHFLRQYCPLSPPDIAHVFHPRELQPFLHDLEHFKA